MSRKEQLRDLALAERSNDKYVKHSTVKVPEVDGEKVTIMRRDNKAGSPWGVYRAEAVMKADFKKACQLMKKTNSDKDAVRVLSPDAKKIEVLSQVDEGSLVHRTDKLTWPLSDRDVHMYAIDLEEADGTYIVASISADNGPKEKSGVVRADLFISTIIITDEGNGKIKVFRSMGIDPKGNIPAMIVDSMISDFAVSLGRIQKTVNKM